jgi:phosphoglycerate dehydrogenase-like enzyme
MVIGSRVRVMVVAPLDERLARRIGGADPRVELLWDPSLVPPARFPGDHLGDPGFRRDPAGVHAVPLAELTIFGLLAVAKDARRLIADQGSRTWGPARRLTRELRGETVFVLGLGGIGLEVARLAKAFGREPLPPSSPLWGLDNVLLSPHTAALSPHEDERLIDHFVDNLRRYLAAEPLRNVVKTDTWY